jgi:hypothetical protein
LEKEEGGLCPSCSSSPGVYSAFLSVVFKKERCCHPIQIRKYQNPEICRICDEKLIIFSTCVICKIQICISCSTLVKCLICKKVFFNTNPEGKCPNCKGFLVKKFVLDLGKAKFSGSYSTLPSNLCPEAGQI